ncbi:IS6 family transposase [Photorhabdus temperata subsp. temperata]
MSLIREAFKRRHYPVDIIAQCVRWYLAYALNLRNLEEMMAERGIAIDHSPFSRWVHRLVPLMIKRYRRSKPAVGRRWRMDETNIKIKGQWSYLYRAVDSGGNTIDFLLTAHRDKKTALRFFKKAMRQHGQPDVVTIDFMLYMNASRLQDKNYSDIDGRLQLYIRPYCSQSCGPLCNPLTGSSLS